MPSGVSWRRRRAGPTQTTHPGDRTLREHPGGLDGTRSEVRRYGAQGNQRAGTLRQVSLVAGSPLEKVVFASARLDAALDREGMHGDPGPEGLR